MSWSNLANIFSPMLFRLEQCLKAINKFNPRKRGKLHIPGLKYNIPEAETESIRRENPNLPVNSNTAIIYNLTVFSCNSSV